MTSVEIIPELAGEAERRLAALGFSNVSVRVGDASLPCPGGRSYDAIVVAAGAAEPPGALVGMLRQAGRLVIPIGAAQDDERLMVFERDGTGIKATDLGRVRFVPLTGVSARPMNYIA